ncbi:MAG: hypothetical protein ABR955_09805 [Verrucomicrobiota bacterium]|jgi:hypothetical protein
MNISKQEAQASLAEIDKAISQTQKAAGHFTGYILMIWGVIWAIGFSATQFFPHSSGWFSFTLDTIGFIGTWVCIRKSKSRFGRPGGGRIGLAWVILFGYMILWGVLLQPGGRASMAFYSTVCMCAYVMMGLWLSRFLLWLGLIVTVLTVAGFYLLPVWFPLWMAITGGGALFLSGLSICKSWK